MSVPEAKILDGQWAHKNDRSVVEIIKDGTVHSGDASYKIKSRGRQIMNKLTFSIEIEDQTILFRLSELDELVWEDGDIWVIVMLDAPKAAGEKAAAASKSAKQKDEDQIQAAAHFASQSALKAGFGRRACHLMSLKAAISVTVSIAKDAGDSDEDLVRKVAATKRTYGAQDGSHHGTARENDVLKLFQRFDRNGDGLISFKELRITLRTINPDFFTDAICSYLFKYLDTDESGNIDFAELTEWIYSAESIAAAVLEASVREDHSRRKARRFDGRWVHKQRMEKFQEYVRWLNNLSGEGGLKEEAKKEAHMTEDELWESEVADRKQGKNWRKTLIGFIEQAHRQEMQKEVEIIKDGRIYLGDSVVVQIRPEGEHSFVIGVEDQVLRATLSGGELVWDDGDIWIPADLGVITEAADEAVEKIMAERRCGRRTQTKEAIKAAIQAAADASEEAGDSSNMMLQSLARTRNRYARHSLGLTVANPQKVMEIFEKLDRKNTGKIPAAQLAGIMQEINPRGFDQDVCTALLRGLNVSAAGEIDFRMFCRWVYGEVDSVLPTTVMSATATRFL